MVMVLLLRLPRPVYLVLLISVKLLLLRPPLQQLFKGYVLLFSIAFSLFFYLLLRKKDIFEIVDQRVLKIYEAEESLYDFKHQFLEEDSSVLLKLSKFRALRFLRIFYTCPRNSLVGCFELYDSTGVDGTRKGNYFLRQLTNEVTGVGAHHPDEGCDDESSIGFTRKKCKEMHPVDNDPPSKGNSFVNSTPAVSKNCLLGLVLRKDPSFKSLIFSRYRMCCDSASSAVISDITSVLEEVFESFILQVKAEDSETDDVEHASSSSKYASQYSVRTSNKQVSSSVVSGRYFPEKFSTMHGPKSSIGINPGIDPSDGESKSVDLYYGDFANFSDARTFVSRELSNRQSFSPRARTPRDFSINSFDGRNLSSQMEKCPRANKDLQVPPTLRSPTAAASFPFESPRQNMLPPHSSIKHAVWYSDVDPATMDIYLASRQLWLRSLGHDASEMLVRFQFEKFGPIDQFRYFPFKGFATIEYRNIMDPLKAREVMRALGVHAFS